MSYDEWYDLGLNPSHYHVFMNDPFLLFPRTTPYLISMKPSGSVAGSVIILYHNFNYDVELGWYKDIDVAKNVISHLVLYGAVYTEKMP